MYPPEAIDFERMPCSPYLQRRLRSLEEVLSTIKTDPELLAKLRAATARPMTKAEVDAQRLSWCIGELMLEHPDLTRDEAERRVRDALGQPKGGE